MKITKAVIPCGGLGTRFLPITKAVPKEILPIVDRPVLSYIVDEARKSGITDILLILGKDKEAIKTYFTPDKQYEKELINKDKAELAALLHEIYDGVNIEFTYQKAPKGTGDAVLYAEKFVNGEPFVLAWGDDLMQAKVPVMRQLIDAYEECGGAVLGVQTWRGDDIVKYGVVKVLEGNGKLHKCVKILEKPKLSELPSRLAALGRYIITPDVFEVIRKTGYGKNGELQLTDSLNSMCASGKVYAYDFEGKRYDMGDKFGALQAIIECSLDNPDYGNDLKTYIKNLAKKI